MSYRLTSQADPGNIIIITNSTWYGLLEVAMEYGWHPIGRIMPWEDGKANLPLAGDWLVGKASTEQSLDGCTVIVEDALNLADALDEAFQDYEPRRVPASYYLFEPPNHAYNGRPGLGAIAGVIEVCRSGAFILEELEFTQLLPHYLERTRSASERRR